MHEWDFMATLADIDLLMLGLWNTLQVCAFALALGVPLGLALALGRMSKIPVLSQLCLLVIEFFRTTPPLVQLCTAQACPMSNKNAAAASRPDWYPPCV